MPEISSPSARRVRALVAVGACAATLMAGAPAAGAVTASSSPMLQSAAPRKIGPVRNLTMSITKPGGYRVTSDWDDLAAATTYRVKLVSSTGTVLGSATVSASRWVASPALTAGSTVTLTVVPVEGKRPGQAARVTRTVPDLTPPTGTYTVALATRTATVTQAALADDLSAPSAITREIDWDDAAGFQPWTTGDQVSHDYPAGARAYHPSVRLTDQAGNAVVVALQAVAIDDTEDPAGAFTVSRTTAWAAYTPVVVTQVGALSDDVSAPADITRTVSWGDGTTATWAGGTALRHVYRTAGTFTPTVTLTDEAGKDASVPTSPVVVRADTAAPRVSLSRPATRATSVRSWIRLRGKATDGVGTGVRRVDVRMVEKRAGRWYAYRATTRTWVRAASKAGALTKSRPAGVRVVSGAWSYRVTGLRKGYLVVKVRATDRVGNVSAVRTYGQSLTRR